MKRLTVTAIGFSHLQALRAAQTIRGEAGRQVFDLDPILIYPPRDADFIPWVEERDGRPVYNEALGRALIRSQDSRRPALVVASFWSSQHFIFCAANHPRRFDFILPDDPALPVDERAEIVPYGLMKSFVELQLGPYLGLLDYIRPLARAPIVMPCAPPPVDDVELIGRGTSAPDLDEEIRKHGIAPPSLRYKFWKLCETVVVERLAAAGVPYLPPPPVTVRPDGFRHPDYLGGDWLHGGPRYGEMVLRQIEAVLAGLAVPAEA
jgi:hypothetical protein